jgi:hypothetical protein
MPAISPPLKGMTALCHVASRPASWLKAEIGLGGAESSRRSPESAEKSVAASLDRHKKNMVRPAFEIDTRARTWNARRLDTHTASPTPPPTKNGETISQRHQNAMRGASTHTHRPADATPLPKNGKTISQCHQNAMRGASTHTHRLANATPHEEW